MTPCPSSATRPVKLRRALPAVTLAVVLLAAAPLSAREAAPAPESAALELPVFRVAAETLRDDRVQTPFLPDTQGTNIFVGKKTLVIDFDAMPQIQTDNYRQAFAKTPGLLTSELSNASLLSLSFRGIGDPHESQNLLVLKDGIPFVLDPFGYPTVYYAPPFESIDRLEFVAGGAALLYGPQPSGALNFVTHEPSRRHAASITSQHVLGSHNLYSTFTTLEGGLNGGAYLGFFDHRSGDSFRDANSDFELNGANLKLVLDTGPTARLVLDLDVYDADSGEPGGLTRATGPGRLNLDQSRTQSQNLYDRVRVERTAAVLRYDRDYADDARLSAAVWVSKFSRFSKRQNGSGFGLVPTGTTNTINLHEYYTYAADFRYRMDYGSGHHANSFTVGTTWMDLDSPIEASTGATPAADTGIRTFKAKRSSRYGSFFAENLFRSGRLTVTPGVRIEILRQGITEVQNNAKSAAGTPLGEKRDTDMLPLFALAATFTDGPKGEFYANFSEGYKPMTYADAVPTGANDTISSDLKPGHVLNYELGRRGRPFPGVWYDVSLFAVDYADRFGRAGRNIQNVGRSINYGVSAATEVDLWRMHTGVEGTSLTWHGNIQLLHAKFVSGPLAGRTPQYAPDVMIRSGLVFRQPGRAKIALLGTYLSEHFADDANTRTPAADWLIPSYVVFDLTAEFYPWRGEVAGRSAGIALLAGINNLLDEKYYSRVRSNGIDPAAPRNFYAGLRFEF